MLADLTGTAVGSDNLNFAQSLAGSEWVPVEISGSGALADGLAVQFRGDGSVRLLSPCGLAEGQYRASDAVFSVAFRPDEATRCADAAMLARTLEAATMYLREGTLLVLRAADGRVVVRLQQTDWD